MPLRRRNVYLCVCINIKYVDYFNETRKKIKLLKYCVFLGICKTSARPFLVSYRSATKSPKQFEIKPFHFISQSEDRIGEIRTWARYDDKASKSKQNMLIETNIFLHINSFY